MPHVIKHFMHFHKHLRGLLVLPSPWRALDVITAVPEYTVKQHYVARLDVQLNIIYNIKFNGVLNEFSFSFFFLKRCNFTPADGENALCQNWLNSDTLMTFASSCC